MTVKRLEANRIPEMIDLASYAFHWEATEQNKKRFTWLAEHSWNYGSLAQWNKLASQVMVTPFEVGFGDKVLSMTGVGFVSTYPEYRKQGRIDDIFKKLLADCYQEGVLLSYLAPFSYPFYRRYGYELVFEQLQITAAPVNWQEKGQSEGEMIRLSAEEAMPLLAEIYPRSQTAQRGGVLRDAWWQQYRFEMGKDFKFAVYYDVAGNAQGYLVYQLENDQLVVEDCQYLNQRALWELRQFMAGHAGTVSQIKWSRAYDGNAEELLLASPTDEIKLLPYMMARIVSLEGFLQQVYGEVKSKTFGIKVTEDQYCPWNNGGYTFAVGEGFKKTEVITGPQLTGSIQSFTQVLLGYKSAKELYHRGKLTGDETAVESLDLLVTDQRPLLGDYF